MKKEDKIMVICELCGQKFYIEKHLFKTSMHARFMCKNCEDVYDGYKAEKD